MAAISIQDVYNLDFPYQCCLLICRSCTFSNMYVCVDGCSERGQCWLSESPPPLLILLSESLIPSFYCQNPLHPYSFYCQNPFHRYSFYHQNPLHSTFYCQNPLHHVNIPWVGCENLAKIPWVARVHEDSHRQVYHILSSSVNTCHIVGDIRYLMTWVSMTTHLISYILLSYNPSKRNILYLEQNSGQQ